MLWFEKTGVWPLHSVYVFVCSVCVCFVSTAREESLACVCEIQTTLLHLVLVDAQFC